MQNDSSRVFGEWSRVEEEFVADDQAVSKSH
jgi:hypothetical protein